MELGSSQNHSRIWIVSRRSNLLHLLVIPSMRSVMKALIPSPIQSIDGARAFIQNFNCPAQFSPYAWRQLQKTALTVWHAHLLQRPYRGSLHFCRPEFYSMLQHPDGTPIISKGSIRGYKAA